MSRISKHFRAAGVIGAVIMICAVSGCAPVSPPPVSSTENPWSWALDEEDKDLINDAVLVSHGKDLQTIEVTAGSRYLLLANRHNYDAIDTSHCDSPEHEAVLSFESLPQSAFNMPWGPHTYFSFAALTAHETTSVTIDCRAPEATIISVADPSGGPHSVGPDNSGE